MQRLFDTSRDIDPTTPSATPQEEVSPTATQAPLDEESLIDDFQPRTELEASPTSRMESHGDALDDATTQASHESLDASSVNGNAVEDGNGEGAVLETEATPDDRRISQRLTRVRTQRVLHNATFAAVVASEFSPSIEVPKSSCGYYLYIGSGPARDGDVASQLKLLGGLPLVAIDYKIGGYDHDITHKAVQQRVMQIASDPKCKGVFVSIPCKTYSVLRGKPGVEHSYPLRNLEHVLGIPRADGTLPFKVAQSNIMSDFAAEVMRTVHKNGGAFAAESPPSRASHSRFPIEGRENHVCQFDHPAWVELRRETGSRFTYFDQCALHDDPSLVARKKTALMLNPKAYEAFHTRFAPLVCTHGYDAHKQSAYGLDANGNFLSTATENYPSQMNRLIAEALIESCESPHNAAPPSANLADPQPMNAWHDHFAADASWPAQRDVADAPKPTLLLEAAAPLLSSSREFTNHLYQTCIDGQLFAAPREISSDNPTYRQARASPEWPKWEEACEREIENLRRNGTIDEDMAIPEDSLPSWDPVKQRASQVTNILWVLRVKYLDGVFDKFKARAVFDGRDQKAKDPTLETFSPACRSTTHKLITAEACRLGYRLRTWDVEAAYLKGVFDKNSTPLFGRPPPGYRQYINGIAQIWRINTPLYGEADAGRIWYKTIVKFLIEERKFTQSKYDPCLFWKVLSDGSRFYIVLYVDDGYSADNGNKESDEELAAINSRFKIDIKYASFFLGNNILCHSTSRVTLTSRAYIERIADKYLRKPLADYPLFDTPCEKNLVKHYEEAAAARRDGVAINESLRESYASKVGAMIYVVPVCRVDCALAIGLLARCLTFPSTAMDDAADRILAYLAQHPNDGITYDANATRPELHAYSDSNWSTSHSTSGWAILYCGAVIGYGSKRQQSIALSSTEAEIMAASMAATEIMYFRGLLAELGHELEPTVLHVDNQGAVELSRDMKSCQRSRHIERRYLKVRELVALGEIDVQFVDTKSNSSDCLTKPLDVQEFLRHTRALMGA